MGTQPETSTTHASAAVVFLRGGQGADLTALRSGISKVKGVTDCAPVLGDWNFVLRIQAQGDEGVDAVVEGRLRPLPGVTAAEAHPCEEALSADKGGAGKASSYAVLDVESDKVEELCARLDALPGVTRRDVTDGGGQVVLKLSGESYRAVRKLLGDQVRLLSGVLRIKQLDII
ncbi:MAG: Lrp/AsnC ligand binding domain-containing protein [Acidobacteriota bacterium]|jgi:DNA-binding Lrp family transcriptional regulator|nr:Lrp/AsnC ligand binding domain-containing protein [Acidobacteriota bacterium]